MGEAKNGFDQVLDELNLIKKGKVRDIYDLPGNRLLIITTDRISAFDNVLPVLIPGKGEILTELSNFWFSLFRDMVPDHCEGTVDDLDISEGTKELIRKRSMVVNKAEVLPVECIVRGYLAGSGYKDYMKTGMVCGIHLPEGLSESEMLPEPLFTPTTKAEQGHDEPITYAQMEELIGEQLSAQVMETSISLYSRAADWARERGIIIADTKFEFGIIDGELTLVDEVLTPDSSRFWPLSDYESGRSQKSFDKQIVRDFLKETGSDGNLPESIVTKTCEKYREILTLLTEGKEKEISA